MLNRQEKRQAPVEKKMRLAQYIRAENMDNRMKIRQREKILYGTENMPPLWNKGEPLRMTEYMGNGEGTGEPGTASGTFRLRMAAAILLFIGFLLCDAGQYRLFGYSMNDICGMISEDYFQLYDAERLEEKLW
ncbi:MAG: hypothetical protein NC341_02720 [Blautia sp.]|nr:hypothetical protein [Blautia sp.]MCM1200530.1 hypothetical protein [Bacteroides fragilis]